MSLFLEPSCFSAGHFCDGQDSRQLSLFTSEMCFSLSMPAVILSPTHSVVCPWCLRERTLILPACGPHSCLVPWRVFLGSAIPGQTHSLFLLWEWGLIFLYSFLKFSTTSVQVSTHLCFVFILIKLTLETDWGLVFVSKPQALVGNFQELCSVLGLGHPSRYPSGSIW